MRIFPVIIQRQVDQPYILRSLKKLQGTESHNESFVINLLDSPEPYSYMEISFHKLLDHLDWTCGRNARDGANLQDIPTKDSSNQTLSV